MKTRQNKQLDGGCSQRKMDKASKIELLIQRNLRTRRRRLNSAGDWSEENLIVQVRKLPGRGNGGRNQERSELRTSNRSSNSGKHRTVGIANNGEKKAATTATTAATGSGHLMASRNNDYCAASSPTVAKPAPAADLTLRQQLDDLAIRAKDSAGRLVHVWTHGWLLMPHCHLPDWLKDNDFLVEGHRPQLGTFADCFKSIFRIHTETGNIWTHMLGCMAFTAIAAYFLTRPAIEIQWQEKLVFSTFFIGAILCLGISFIFHTVYCHSERVGRLFNKLDYCGISLLTMGSFVPWLYYGFYCQLVPKIVYISLIGAMGLAAIVLSMFDAFAAPKYRPLRAGVFVLLGLSGAIPVLHYVIIEGFHNAIYNASMGWLSLMAVLYITGAVIYAVRFPERLFPGKFDIWLQSHQIFHVFVVAAAFVHFHGINGIANYRLTDGDCPATGGLSIE